MNKNFMISAAILIPLINVATLAQPAPDLPGITRSTNNIYLIENHSTAFNIWHARNIRNSTVVHIDAHDDCRYITPAKLEALNKLTAARSYGEIFSQSDLEFSFRYKLKPDKFLFDIGNFIYPCIMDGTVSRLYWVIPDKALEANKISFLQRHLSLALKLPALNLTDSTNNSFSFSLSNCTVTVTTLDAMPRLDKGAVLDIDTDFFVFPCSLTESHIRGQLLWDPPKVCAMLSSLVPDPSVITIASSISGGYLPVTYRFISDGLFEYYATGTYPEDAVHLLKTVTAMLAYPPVAPQPWTPRDHVFLPACEHITGMSLMVQGEENKAIACSERAARLNPAYSKALLDIADVFLSMGKSGRAHEMIDRFEKLLGSKTSHSEAARIRVYVADKQLQKADTLSRKLVDWDRSNFFLMLRGGVMAEQGLLPEAIAIYREIINLKSDDGTAYYNLGFALAKQGKIQEAINNYKLALTFKPDLAVAHENLGYILSNNEKFTEAASYLKTAVALNPFNIATLNNLGLALARQNLPHEAISYFKAAARLDQERPEIRANLAMALINSGRLTEGIECCKEALKLKPDWPEVINMMNEAKRKKSEGRSQ